MLRATRHPHYFDFNYVRVEAPTGMDADGLIEVADRGLRRAGAPTS